MKYTINDFNLTNNEITEIDLWVKNKDFNKIIIITGNIGCGKNTLAHIILKDYTIITINDYDENLNETINDVFISSDISRMFDKNKMYKSLIFDNILINSMKYISTIINKLNNNVPTIFISNIFHLKYNTYIKNKLCIKLNKTISSIGDKFIYNVHELINRLNEFNIVDLFKILQNDYNTIMLDILEYIPNKIDTKKLEKIYYSCLLYDNYNTFKNINNIYETDLLILFGVIIPKYYCKNISFANVKNNSYTSRSIIYTQMKNLYKVNTYEYYIITLYLYLYNKHDNIHIYNLLNKKIITHYIKLFNIVYKSNIIKTKNLLNLI
tara:strand:+ start:476 stop:1447 length:972 start_codon:yes stop_codon:yes gene_type:complete